MFSTRSLPRLDATRTLAENGSSRLDFAGHLPVATMVDVDNTNAFDFSSSEFLSPATISRLQSMGYPLGLIAQLGKAKAAYPIRFWIVDNSSSMEELDGEVLLEHHDSSVAPRVVACTRWQELQSTVHYQAGLAGLLSTNTTFRLLNGASSWTVADPNDMTQSSTDSSVRRLQSGIQAARPQGCTPLTEQLRQIYQQIQGPVAQRLRSENQRAVVVLATDGLPSDAAGRTNHIVTTQFLESLRTLQALPVWIVIRLCTDTPEVVEFYSNLDRKYELPLDVLDDVRSEAKEVQEHNPWLNYTLPLHRFREMGCHCRLLDMLDERPLAKDQMFRFLGLLLGENVLDTAPSMHTEWKQFLAFVQPRVHALGKAWNPSADQMEYWIDMKQLEDCYGPASKSKQARLFFARRKNKSKKIYPY